MLKSENQCGLLMPNHYIPNDTDTIRKKMFETLNINDIDQLYSDIPKVLQPNEQLDLPDPLSEIEVTSRIEKIVARNRTSKQMLSFLGAGVWPHYVPAIVDEISSRSEFSTSYTPYQSEISQGMLQALFEYQSMICELLNMDISNSSMYDWASALGEAARMSARVTQKSEFLIPQYISPERKTVLKSYTEPAGIRILEINNNPLNGQLDLEDLKNRITEETAGVYVENPSYFGVLSESLQDISDIAHDAKALFLMGVEPTSLGVVKPPGDYGADIAIGEGQPLGNYMNAGGPSLGIFACKEDDTLLRQMPGRIIGMTTVQDSDERAFCMVLQTREQHIRRHKATSNICTNEALCALRTAVYLSSLGPKGFARLGQIILSRTDTAIKHLSELRGVRAPLFKAHHFKEFTVNFDMTSRTVRDVNSKLLMRKIIGGHPLISEFPNLGETALYCVTELHSLEDVECLKVKIEEILEGGN